MPELSKTLGWRFLHLIPSSSRLTTHDARALGVAPLWETTQGELVFCMMGVKGDKAPAGVASGRVECRWAEPGDEVSSFSLAASGVPRGGHIECKGLNPVVRQLIVRAPDGLLEALPVTCFEALELEGHEGGCDGA